jgi:sugar transferase EpsL
MLTCVCADDRRSHSTEFVMYPSFIKRVLDFVAAALALTVFFPALVALAILIAFKLGRPVIFQQRRPGKDRQPFMLVKFRSMTEARDRSGRLLPDSKRITSFGQFLRSSSLDELPELWNVLKGEMSLVGPRPLLMEYLPYYSKTELRRHDVRPGITGWAQINGRNALSWDERFKLDLEYVEKCSLWFDLKILALTVLKVFKREGISAKGHATMPSLVEERRSRPNSASSPV